MFVEEFLRLVNFSRQVWAAATIGVVEQHELAVVLADLVLGQSSFTEKRNHVSSGRSNVCSEHIRKL